MDTETHIETTATLQESTNREISSSYHVIRVGLRLNKPACREGFDRFRQIHDDCIQYIVHQYDELPASVGLKDLKEIFLEKTCKDQRRTA